MAKNTKMPPCGARSVTSNAMTIAPVTALPTMIERDDPQRVGRRERDRALGDERRAEQPGRLAVLALGRREQPGPDDGGQRERERRHHAGEP